MTSDHLDPPTPTEIDAGEWAEFVDACETAEHVHGVLLTAALLLTEQVARTSSVYGAERTHWPASSYLYVLGLEDGYAAARARLAGAQTYARELHGSRPTADEDNVCVACKGGMPCAPWCPFDGEVVDA